MKCRKWCKDLAGGEEWCEEWAEYDIHGGRKEKWCDKWSKDLQTEISVGEKWGSKYPLEEEIQDNNWNYSWYEKWQREPQ